MDANNIFDGFAVIIDDQIGKEEKEINNLIKQIKNRNMPCVTYSELPELDITKHFANISFLLLDWKLQPDNLAEHVPEGVVVPNALNEIAEEENISFLKKMQDSFFIPIFIFTNEDIDRVENILHENGLYKKGKPNTIFIKRKRDLFGSVKLFRTLEKWIKDNPSIYVLKKWEMQYRVAKTQLFKDFYSMSPFWPNILWKNFREDGVNMAQELGEIITKNIYSRMAPFSFNDNTLKKRSKIPSKTEIRSVLEGERFIRKDQMDSNSIASGDLFEIKENGKKKIYLNIRPDCDCIPDRNNTNSSIDDVELYLLKGSKLSPKKEKETFNKKYGNFSELDNQTIVFSMLNGNTFDFRFKDITKKKWKDIKNKRIGRLQPPYITRVQQRYSLYLQRQGLPRIPDKAI